MGAEASIMRLPSPSFMRFPLFAGFLGFILTCCFFAYVSNYNSSPGKRNLLQTTSPIPQLLAADPTMSNTAFAAVPSDQTCAADKQRIAALEAEVQRLKGGAVATAKDIGDGAQTEMMSMANNGQGFAMLQPGQGIKSLVIEIGLHSAIMDPKPEQFIIGVEASLKSLCKPETGRDDGVNPFDFTKPRTAFFPAAMGSRVGVTDWYERAGWTAANSMAKQDTMVAYHGPTKAVTSITIAPVVTLTTILVNVPATMPLALLKIDAQAHNYYIVVGAGDHIKRAAVIFTECTIDMAADGKTGASVYGDENDNCSNIRKHLEGKGFIYMGSITDQDTDKTGDMMFARPEYAGQMRPCVNVWQGMSRPKQGEEDCLHSKITPLVHRL